MILTELLINFLHINNLKLRIRKIDTELFKNIYTHYPKQQAITK